MLLDFVKATVRHWVNWMSGLVGVLLWIGGFVADTRGWSEWSKRSFWAAGGCALLFTFYSVWREEHRQLIAVQKRMKGFPKLKLAENGFHADVFHIVQEHPHYEPYSVLRLRIVNDPDGNTPESVAKGVRAGLSFFSEDGQKLLELDGRWTDSPQPSVQDPEHGVVPYLTAEFPIGQSCNLDLVAKRFHETDCFGLNNDSFHFMYLAEPEVPVAFLHDSLRSASAGRVHRRNL